MTVLSQAKRNNWLAAGRRWRKTTLGAVIAVSAAQEGRWILWGAPTFDQVRIAWDMVRRARVANLTQTRMTADFKGGGKIIFRSLDDPDNARGHTADGVIFDETGDIRPAAYYEIVRPMLIDTDGWFWGLGTPKGRNWFWKEYSRAGTNPNSARWQVPTRGCRIDGGRLIQEKHPLENPHVPFSEIENLFRELPERVFQQEILAEFIEGEGAVFRNIEANLWTPKQEQIAEHIGHRTVVGVDWGKHQDFTTISVVCTECMCEIEKDRFNKIDYTFQRDRLKRLVDKWKPVRVLAEQNAMEANLEMLQREGVRVIGWTMTSANKPGLISSLAVSLEKEEVRWLDDPIWTAELEAFEQQVNKVTGRSSYSAPQGLHDDTVIARALAREAVAMSHRRSIYI